MLVSPVHEQLPRWLEALLNKKFFTACLIHDESKKNEKKFYCLDCCTSICSHCLTFHSSHRLLQIRRYVYQDVLKLDDALQLIDCSDVQSYTTNSAKVIFIKQRPRPRQFGDSGAGNVCNTCDRSLQDSYLFCSLYCKVKAQKGGLSNFLFDSNFLPLPEQDGLITPDSVFEPAESFKSSSSSRLSDELIGCRTFVRKKRSSLTACRSELSPESEILACRQVNSPESEISATLMVNRRKKTPHRAPLY